MTDTTERRPARRARPGIAQLVLACLVASLVASAATSSPDAQHDLRADDHTVGGHWQPASASPATAAADVQRRFIGNWRLIAFESIDEQGRTSPNPLDVGRIMYDADGNMAAQLMRSVRKPASTPPTEAERAASYSSYVAYFGRYTIDTTNDSVTHHVEAALNPNWVKTPLVRYWRFSPDGTRLMLSTRNAAGRTTGTLTWERLR
jgi:hypothetical protein